jgi:uncharacterized protein YecE (DUF72 family)
MNNIIIGTCGWSYKDWKGNLYPAKCAAGDYLSRYAEHFSIVEVDGTFYRQPDKKLIEGWDAKTPAGFRFAPKVPQVITHEKLLVNCEEDTEYFASMVRLLGPKLLCVCLQFGYFNRKVFSKQSLFMERLDAYLKSWPKDIPLAVELRNDKWVNQDFADLLRAHNAVWVLADTARMPSPLEVFESMNAITGPFAYVRLLGVREAVDAKTATFDQIVVDKSEDLKKTAKAIMKLSTDVPVATFVNNHYAGHAPSTVRMLKEELKHS